MSPCFQAATSAAVSVSRLTRFAVEAGAQVTLGQSSSAGGSSETGAGTVEHEMRVARGGAVGDHRDGLVRGVRGVVADLDVEHRGQAAQALCADAERIDLRVKFDAQFFQFGFRPAREQLVHVERLHQHFLGHHHRFLRGPADADADQAGRAPARAHGGHGFQHPVDHRVRGIEHGELRFGLGAAALGRDRDMDRVAGHNLHVHHGGCVVLGVLAREQRIGKHRAAQGLSGLV